MNTYLWDAEQRLIRIKRKGDGQTSNISYDGLGRRTSITETKQGDTAPNKTTRYVYCGSPTPCAANGTTGLTILEPQGEYNAISTPTQQYYAKDHQGSVMQMVDGQGNTLGTRQYTVYGQTMQASGVAPTLGYAGMLYHAPSGLYLTPYRAYNPANGRWLSRDPIGEDGGGNLYGYAAANPLSFVDSFGLRPLTDTEKGYLAPYIPARDLNNADLHVGEMPGYAPRWATGITRGNDIYFRDPNQTFATPVDLGLLGHELVHVGQYADGMTWLTYLWASRNGYDNNPYERDAYRIGDQITKELRDKYGATCP